MPFLHFKLELKDEPGTYVGTDYLIRFKDFVPQDKTGFFSVSRRTESLEEAVGRANEWIQAEDSKVINVETVLLPGVKSEEDADAAVAKQRDLSSFSPFSQTNWMQIIRVWYQE